MKAITVGKTLSDEVLADLGGRYVSGELRMTDIVAIMGLPSARSQQASHRMLCAMRRVATNQKMQAVLREIDTQTNDPLNV